MELRLVSGPSRTGAPPRVPHPAASASSSHTGSRGLTSALSRDATALAALPRERLCARRRAPTKAGMRPTASKGLSSSTASGRPRSSGRPGPRSSSIGWVGSSSAAAAGLEVAPLGAALPRTLALRRVSILFLPKPKLRTLWRLRRPL